jgi:exodeoxyribonuclease-5
MNWSPQQDDALRDCAAWIKDKSGPQVFYLAGYAGTGKTTLARHLVGDDWRFAAFTGKAAHVLRQKGCEDASTIHSLIYRPAGESKASEMRRLESQVIALQTLPRRNEAQNERLELLQRMQRDLMDENKPRFALWENSPLADARVRGIVVDEVSMVDEKLGKDLEYFGKKILVLGDPAQLPPVGAGGYFTKREPDVMLTEVHRHARESGILRLATHIREGGSVWGFDSAEDAQVVPQLNIEREALRTQVLDADQVLCGLNATRHNMNKRQRTLLGFTDPGPMMGDRLVCLRNDHMMGLFNGSQWLVDHADCDVDSMTADMQITSEDTDARLELTTWLHHMVGKGDALKGMGHDRRDLAEFDWSYALTVHKAQGSQWEDVVLFDQSASFRADARKWLYTGITRASKSLTVII